LRQIGHRGSTIKKAPGLFPGAFSAKENSFTAEDTEDAEEKKKRREIGVRALIGK
jgi:hypothetical protein